MASSACRGACRPFWSCWFAAFWASFLIRIYAWMNILQYDGLLDRLLLALHIVREPPVWLATDTAIYIGIVYCYLPFMVLPLSSAGAA